MEATGKGKGNTPFIDRIQSLAGTKIVDDVDPLYIKFSTFRQLKTDDKDDAVLKLNTLTDLRWGENKNDPLALNK